MRIEINTTPDISPLDLWNKIKAKIRDNIVRTWEIVRDGDGKEALTHVTSSQQWYRKAALKPTINTNPSRLFLRIIALPDEVIPDHYTQALYIGRFTETLMEHFSTDFIKLETFP
ncbi:hypothetical protein [Ferruginibacter sp. HRS2-29]|uniref:hypothetical protein n=1 Tax=Ferruginibacter sp. HRS2-29 TaxID=2487334 RepID=UPI0020CEB4CA|nr:hypothetical protein [Ferruginibacter sp. HRS2-29]MCP9750372.1 hypothetical protein [Ferruginibacter sp. HRS2-29]